LKAVLTHLLEYLLRAASIGIGRRHDAKVCKWKEETPDHNFLTSSRSISLAALNNMH
jgi:hypothetical protein